MRLACLWSGPVAAAAMSLVSCRLSSGEKNGCIEQADCNAGYVCQSGVCQRRIDIPGIVSTEPFTGAELFLVNLAAPGTYQVVLEYDATTAGAAVGMRFGSGGVSLQSVSGEGGMLSSGPLQQTAGGPYTIGIVAGSGVAIDRVWVLACSEGYQSNADNCGACGNTCAETILRYKPDIIRLFADNNWDTVSCGGRENLFNHWCNGGVSPEAAQACSEEKAAHPECQ
jgi:hypothetical protein